MTPAGGVRNQNRARGPYPVRTCRCGGGCESRGGALILAGERAQGRGRPAHGGIRVGQELGRRGDRLRARTTGRALRAARPGLPGLGGRWHWWPRERVRLDAPRCTGGAAGDDGPRVALAANGTGHPPRRPLIPLFARVRCCYVSGSPRLASQLANSCTWHRCAVVGRQALTQVYAP